MNNFGGLFKKYRLRAEFDSLSSLADALAEKGYFYELSLFCHWQKGRRIPTKRIILITLLSIFIERGAIQSLQEANDFLESAGHGYLTNREQEQLFPNNFQTPQASL